MIWISRGEKENAYGSYGGKCLMLLNVEICLARASAGCRTANQTAHPGSRFQGVHLGFPQKRIWASKLVGLTRRFQP